MILTKSLCREHLSPFNIERERERERAGNRLLGLHKWSSKRSVRVTKIWLSDCRASRPKLLLASPNLVYELKYLYNLNFRFQTVYSNCITVCITIQKSDLQNLKSLWQLESRPITRLELLVLTKHCLDSYTNCRNDFLEATTICFLSKCDHTLK